MTWSEDKAYLEQNLQDLVTCRMRGCNGAERRLTPHPPRAPLPAQLSAGGGESRVVGAPSWGAEMAPGGSGEDAGGGRGGRAGRVCLVLRLPAGFCLF